MIEVIGKPQISPLPPGLKDRVDANSAAYEIGAVVGGLVIGMLCCFIPLALGRKRERAGLD
jgi:hypothetical protein